MLYGIDNYRDYAMVLVMLDAGLRVSEACKIDKEDIDFDLSIFSPPIHVEISVAGVLPDILM